jgi:hypothetical protein
MIQRNARISRWRVEDSPSAFQLKVALLNEMDDSYKIVQNRIGNSGQENVLTLAVDSCYPENTFCYRSYTLHKLELHKRSQIKQGDKQ